MHSHTDLCVSARQRMQMQREHMRSPPLDMPPARASEICRRRQSGSPNFFRGVGENRQLGKRTAQVVNVWLQEKKKKRILASVIISARRKGSRTRANILHFRDRISMWPYGNRVERHKTFTYPQAPPITNRLFSTTGSKHRQHNYMLQYYYDSCTERDCFSPQLDILPSSLCFKLEI